MEFILKKPKQFTASKTTVNVSFGGIERPVANLLKSGITNNTSVLVGHDKLWYEINLSDLTIAKQVGNTASDMQYIEVKTSNLEDFKKHVEKHNFTLWKLGILKNEKPDFNYMDFFSIAKYSKMSYLDIEKLNNFELKESGRSSMYDLRITVKHIDDMNLTVNEYIENRLKTKNLIINNAKMEAKNEKTMKERKITRINDLNSLGMVLDEFEGNWVGYGFAVTVESIENDSDNDWQSLYENIFNHDHRVLNSSVEPKSATVPEPTASIETAPIANAPEPVEPTKPSTNLITLELIGNMKPESISELQGLQEKQTAVVKSNPFVKITDAKSLKKAKAAKSALLKASTETESIEKNASKYLNTFKAMIKKIVGSASEITRTPHDLQATEITAYENAEALRVQEEQRLKLEKIQGRTKRLFAVPFVFNGALYQIGTLYVTPSQVETSTDEEFELIVKQGESIKQALDEAKKAESAKDAMIKELQDKLAELLKPAPVAEVVAEAVKQTEPAAPTAAVEPAAAYETNPDSVSVSAPNPTTPSDRVLFKFKPIETYVLPAPGNVILNKFDMEYVEHVQAEPIPMGYIKSRQWLKHGTRLLADEILNIMANPDPSVKKAPLIIELCTIIKNDI